MSINAENHRNKELNIFIQPLGIYYECYDYHFIFYFKNHPEYEAIEAMINENISEGTKIRAIITRLDKTQIDHINEIKKSGAQKNLKNGREIYYTSILYKRVSDKGKTQISMEFQTFKGEKMAISFNTVSEAAAKYSRLIDPKGHSDKSSFPVMYPEMCTLAAPNSCIVIDGRKYKAPVKVWIPLFFKAVRGFYSEIFKIGIFTAPTKQITLLKAPFSLVSGEKWVYKTEGKKFIYEIEEVRGCNILIRGDSEKISVVNENGLKIKKITKQSILKDRKVSNFNIEFQPAIPILSFSEDTEEKTAEFKISIDNHKSLIMGDIRIVQDGNTASIHLIPQQPQWASERSVRTKISAKDNTYIFETKIN